MRKLEYKGEVFMHTHHSTLGGYNMRSGKIRVNPHLPPENRKLVRVHETIELKLRKKGYTLREAHKEALKKEHKGMSSKKIQRYEGVNGAIAKHYPMRGR